MPRGRRPDPDAGHGSTFRQPLLLLHAAAGSLSSSRVWRVSGCSVPNRTVWLTFDPSQDVASPFSLLPRFVKPASVASPADSARTRTRSAFARRFVERHETRIASDFLRQFEIDYRRRLSRFRLLGERDVQCGREEEGRRRRVGTRARGQRRREMPRVGRRQRVVEVIL